MESYISALRHNDPALILSGPNESLETHLIVFAAEQARKENRIIQVKL